LTEPLYIHRQSCYLFGRERRVADIPTDHPSCSKQHAVIQFRYFINLSNSAGVPLVMSILIMVIGFYELSKIPYLIRQVEKEQPDGTLLKQIR